MQHLNNIFLNFNRKILKIERVTVNLRRCFEKKLFVAGLPGELCEEVLCKIVKRLVQ